MSSGLERQLNLSDPTDLEVNDESGAHELVVT